MKDEVFMEGGLKFFTALALENAIEESVQILWGLLPKNCINIGLYIAWKGDETDLRAPAVPSLTLLLSDNRDTKKYPPVKDDQWTKKFGVEQDRIMRAKRQLIKIWDAFTKKAKGLPMEYLRCMIVVEYVGRYYYRLYSINPNSNQKEPEPTMLTSTAASKLIGGEKHVLAENYGQEFDTSSLRIDI